MTTDPKCRRAAIASVVVVAVALGCARESERGDRVTLLLHGGKVFTADDARPWAEAVAIRGERILAVGADDEVLALASRSTERIDLRGRVVVPGFNDAHVHTAAPLEAHDLDLPFDPPAADVLDAIRHGVAATPAGTWLGGTIGGGVFDDRATRRDALDALAPAHPVLLRGWTGHGCLLNSAALAALGLDGHRTAGFAGWIETDETGEQTGLFQGYECFRIAAARTRPVDAESVAAFQAFAREAMGYGITSVQQMAMPYSIEKSLAVLEQARVPLRWRLIDFPLQGADALAPEPSGRVPANVTVSGVKWILDGTPEERWMAMREPFVDRPDWSGRFYLGEDDLAAAIEATLARGEQLVAHAVGDRAIETLLATMEAAEPAERWRQLRPRIEHGDGLAPDLRPRVAALGLMAVQNPSHFTIADLVDRRLGEARRHGFQPMRSLAAAGIPLALGSDGPLNPFLNIMFAVLHPVAPAEALSVEQAVVAYTVGSARAELREHEKGALRPGLAADLAVLSQDIFTVAPNLLPLTTAELTVIAGEVVHRAGVEP